MTEITKKDFEEILDRKLDEKLDVKLSSAISEALDSKLPSAIYEALDSKLPSAIYEALDSKLPSAISNTLNKEMPQYQAAIIEALDFKFEKVENEITGLRTEMKSGFERVDKRLVGIDSRLENLESSARAFDGMLEQYPVPRIERLEKHVDLPQFVPTIAEE